MRIAARQSKIEAINKLLGWGRVLATHRHMSRLREMSSLTLHSQRCLSECLRVWVSSSWRLNITTFKVCWVKIWPGAVISDRPTRYTYDGSVFSHVVGWLESFSLPNHWITEYFMELNRALYHVLPRAKQLTKYWIADLRETESLAEGGSNEQMSIDVLWMPPPKAFLPGTPHRHSSKEAKDKQEG